MSTDLSALRARVEEATGPDREIDARIACALDDYDSMEVVHDCESSAVIAVWVITGVHRDDPPHYTSSLDDALGLVTARLPGPHWRVEKTCEYPGLAFRTHQFTAWCGDWGTPKRAEGATPALALLSALLSALETQ